MRTKTKSKIAKVSALAVGMTLAVSLGVSPIFASAEGGAGGVRSIVSQYTSRAALLEAARDVDSNLANEGFVLLKNENAALPLNTAEEGHVTLLGLESYRMQTGGGGSGTTSRPTGWTGDQATLQSSLRGAGFIINPTVEARYDTQRNSEAANDRLTYMQRLGSEDDTTGSTEFGGAHYATTSENFLAGQQESIAQYGDAAIISLSRAGSEGTDNTSHDVSGHSDTSDFYFSLTDSERQVLAYAKHLKAEGTIKKIIVILNTPSVMEVGDIESDDAFDSVLWVGVTGWNGAAAIGRILNGSVNPSGKTVDFWMTDFLTDPTTYNVGDYSQASYAVNGAYRVPEGGHGMNYGTYFDFGSERQGSKAPAIDHDPDGDMDNEGYATTYSEGIFMGYRYYESVAADLNAADTEGEEGSKVGDVWYNANTTYPFGHGLSYTTFTQEITAHTGDLSDPNGEITVTVRVTNTGKVAGKDVVQLYNTPEYHDGGIDKAEVNLVGFAKTGVIAAGASEDVTVTISVKDLAEFDYNDKNANGNSGYELENGEYKLSIRKNSHEEIANFTLTAENTSGDNTASNEAGEVALVWDEDGDAATPNNIFSQESGVWEQFNTHPDYWTTTQKDHDLHRNGLLNEEKNAPSDLKELAWLLTEDNSFTDRAFRIIQNLGRNSITEDNDDILTEDVETDYVNLWTKTNEDVQGYTQAVAVDGVVAGRTDGLAPIQISAMAGVDYDDAQWTTFLNQLTWQEITELVSAGGYQTAAVDAIGKQRLSDQDGPAQMSGGWAWVCAVVIASTWNVELAEEQGKIISNESIWQGGTGWYGPAMNTHRNPISGRNFEYYSQDGLQGGLIAAAVCKGVTDNGGRVYIKHSFLNDQETSRVGVASLVNEQALRQIYAKPFELAIKNGNANGIMTSFNTIGFSSTASYAVNIQLYEKEWGYKGATVTDYYMGPARDGWTSMHMIRGCVFPLGTARVDGTWNAEARDGAGMVEVGGVASPTQYYWARETAKRILYVHANANGPMLATAQSLGDAISGPITAQVGEDINAQLVNLTSLTEFFGAGNYEVSVTVPSVLNYNEETGYVTGNIAIPYTLTASIQITNNSSEYAYLGETINRNVTITVEGDAPEMFTISQSEFDLELGGAVNVTSSVNRLVDGLNWAPSATAGNAENYQNGNGYIGAIAYSATGLPGGVSIDEETGVISGTPYVTGDYNVTVTATLQRVTRTNTGSQWRPNYVYSTTAETHTQDLTISISGGVNVTVNNGFGDDMEIAVPETGATVSSINLEALNDIAPGIGMTAVGITGTANGEALDSSAALPETIYVVWQYPAITMIGDVIYINGISTELHLTGPQGPAGNDGTNGTNGTNGADGTDGTDGTDGVGIESVTINADGHLIITLTDGSEPIDLGVVKGADGADGADGERGPAGPAGPAGADGADGSGCGGNVATTAALAGVAMMLFAAGVVVARKRNANK